MITLKSLMGDAFIVNSSLRRNLRNFKSTLVRNAIFTSQYNSPEGIENLGKYLSNILANGDIVLLSGDLGAGKTTLTRGIIRSKCEDPTMIVTSPSYLLDNTYDLGDEIIHHMDLYRLPTGCDLTMLGIPQIFDTSICIIEWPQRMGTNLPEKSLCIDIKIDSADNRRVEISSKSEEWQARFSSILSELNAQNDSDK